jgi:hypothetical protein
MRTRNKRCYVTTHSDRIEAKSSLGCVADACRRYIQDDGCRWVYVCVVEFRLCAYSLCVLRLRKNISVAHS